MKVWRSRDVPKLLLLCAIRWTPLPWRFKWRLIWLFAHTVMLGAAALSVDRQGRILIVRSRYSGRWQLPGGDVRRGERIEAALRRECREELKLEIDSLQLLGIYPVLRGLSQIALFRVCFVQGTIVLSVEHSAWRRCPRNALPRELWPLLSQTQLDGF